MSLGTIAFIGGGNMATSLIAGLIDEGVPPDTVWVTDVDEARLALLQERYEVRTTGDNDVAVSRAQTVVLAVKPQVMADVVHGIAGSARAGEPLIVSIAAGVTEAKIREGLGYDAAIVRTMPNTPALVRAGATALYANASTATEQRARADAILRAVGLTVWVDDESLIDAVTAVSGSGPAYYFLVMEAMEAAGIKLGLDPDTARKLTLQTALGAARIALEGDEPPGTLRQRVTSPGGTTQAAIESLQASGLEQIFEVALTAARDRSVELGRG